MKALNIIGFFLLFLSLVSRANSDEIQALDSMENYYELIQTSSFAMIERLYLSHREMAPEQHAKIRQALLKKSKENSLFLAEQGYFRPRPCDRFIMAEDIRVFNIHHQNLADSLFIEVQFGEGSFLNVNIIQTKFIGCDFFDFVMKNSSIDAAFIDCKFENGAIDTCVLSNTLFHQNQFHETKITNTDFRGSKCQLTYFNRCRVETSNFENADMQASIIECGYWVDTTLKNAWINNMELRNPIIFNNIEWSAKYKQIFAYHIDNNNQIKKETIYQLALWKHFNTLHGLIDVRLVRGAVSNFLVEAYEQQP